MGHYHFVSLNCLETFQNSEWPQPMAYLPLHFESVRQEHTQWSSFSCWQLPLRRSADAREFCAARPAASHPSWVAMSCGCACPCAEQVLATPKNWSRCGWETWRGSSVGSTNDWKMNELLVVRFLQPPFIRRVQHWWGSNVRPCNSWLLSAEFATASSIWFLQKRCLGGCLCLQTRTPHYSSFSLASLPKQHPGPSVKC